MHVHIAKNVFLISSSIGMAKAALEAMNGFNLYGDKGSSSSVVYVDVVRIEIITQFHFMLFHVLGCT